MKIIKTKKKQPKKNLNIKISAAAIKADKPKGSMSTKGSFVQEFKKIRKEIESELKREDMKYKSRVSTACVSPKNVANSMIAKPEEELVIEDNEIQNPYTKKSIRRFMKQKKRKLKREKILERSQEIKKHFKIKENLKVLNKYVRHIRDHSSGLYYNRSSGCYETRKQKPQMKFHKGFEKARTPKYNDLSAFNFNFMQKNNPTSDPNLKTGMNEGIRNLQINVDTQGKSTTDFYKDYFKGLMASTQKSTKKTLKGDLSDSQIHQPQLLTPNNLSKSPARSKNKSHKSDSGK